MKKKDITIFIIVVILVAFNNNCFEYLTNHNVKAAQTLFYRGLFTLILTIIYGKINNEKLLPTNFKGQSIRLITTGGALLFILQSYFYLSAGTVSLLQRLDIPFLIFISLIAKKPKKKFQIILSIIFVIAIVITSFNADIMDEETLGFLFIFGGVSMTAIGYLTVHNGSTKESTASLINISSISSIIFGASMMLYYEQDWLFDWQYFGVIFISAILNIVLSYFIIDLYKIYTPERALLPFVVGIFSTSILEMIIEQKTYHWHDIILKIILTFIIIIICFGGKRQTA